MAKKSLIIKTARRNKANAHRVSLGIALKPKMGVRSYNRCSRCGRVHGYIRRFDMCRICFRELARTGMVMGLKKSSW